MSQLSCDVSVVKGSVRREGRGVWGVKMEGQLQGKGEVAPLGCWWQGGCYQRTSLRLTDLEMDVSRSERGEGKGGEGGK